MKIAPLHRALDVRDTFDLTLVHTGQHYDDKMSKIFFDDLRMPKPDIYLGVGSGTHAQQTAGVMQKLEPIFIDLHPDLVVVVGDVNSTLSAALTASKLHIPVAHIEAGLRSNNRSMPEEINRILTDAISDYLFVSEESGLANLKKEGVADAKIFHVGNVMIDSLKQFRDNANESTILRDLAIKSSAYAVLTLHRPSNVDLQGKFTNILRALEKIQWEIPIVFPIHPRTRKQLEGGSVADIISRMPYFILTEPLGYLDFLKLMMESKFLLTDSGGIQEETTSLGIPCLTLREETERPATVTVGTNTIVGSDSEKIITEARRILDGEGKKGTIPELWDGKSSDRIADVFINHSMTN